MQVVTSIKPPVSSHLHPRGGKCVATGGEEWQRRWFDAGSGVFIKTSAGLVQPNVLDWVMSLEMKQEEREEGRFEVWRADPGLKCYCGWCDNSEAWEESNRADLVCLACLSRPFNENGMQCPPPPTHTCPHPSLYRATLCPTVHPHYIQLQSSKQQQGGRRWMRMDEWMCPFQPSLPFPSNPQTASRIPPLCSRPLLTPGFAASFYDRGQCVLHTYLLAPILRRAGCPYKGLSSPKVRSEPCTQVLSRHSVWKNKNSLLASTVPVVGMTPEAAMASEVNVTPQI